MVFTGNVLLLLVFIVLIVWNLGLTIFIYRVWHHYSVLTQGATKQNLAHILETVLRDYGKVRENLADVEKEIDKLEEEGKFHIQRVGVLRFNPFSDTGGSQSFTVSVLDGKANGIVMTSLYARTGNRWYVKEVRNGKGKDLELSKEEVAAIGKAVPIKG